MAILFQSSLKSYTTGFLEAVSISVNLKMSSGNNVSNFVQEF